MPASFYRRYSSAALLLLGMSACVTLVGCSAGKGDVTGKVSYKGTPLKGGVVTFASSDGGPNRIGMINEDGTYLIPNVPSGSYKVCVDTESLKPQAMTDAPGGYKAPGGAGNLAKAVESGKVKTAPPATENKMPEGAGYKDGFATMKANAANYIPIPLSYAKPETTDLAVDVKGNQTFDIDLKSK